MDEAEVLKECRRLMNGDISFKKERLWNPSGFWPDDFNDKKQAPHGRPIDYYIGTVAGVGVAVDGIYGCDTKAEAIAVAEKFTRKCADYVSKSAITGTA